MFIAIFDAVVFDGVTVAAVKQEHHKHRYVGARNDAMHIADYMLIPSPIELFHITDDGLPAAIYVHMLDTDKLLTATTHAAENFHLH